MKKTTKIVALFLAIVLSLSIFSGCDFGAEAQAKNEVDRVMSKFKGENLDEIRELLGINQTEDASSTELLADAVLTMLLKNFDYEIVDSEKIDNNNVDVTVSVVNTNMVSVVGEFVEEVTQFTVDNIKDSITMTEEERIEKYTEILENILSKEDLKTSTQEVVIHVKKVDGQWEVNLKDTVVDAILGGYITAFDSFV